MSFFHLAGSNNVRPTVILGNQEGELSSDVNFTRNTKGSRWDSEGDNELIGVDQPRYNYNPATGLYEGMTIMGQWTNEIKDPRDATTGNWTPLKSATVSRDVIGIDGEANTAFSVSGDHGNGDRVYQRITIPDDSNTNVVCGLVRKNQGISEFYIRLRNGTNEVHNFLKIDTDNGTPVNSSAQFIDYDDWWLVYGTATNNSSGNTRADIAFYSNDDANDNCVWDAVGVFLNRSAPPPTPVYGETAGQSYTQDPDIATVTDLDAIDFNPQEGTIVVEFLASAPTVGQRILSVNDGSTGNQIDILVLSETTIRTQIDKGFTRQLRSDDAILSSSFQKYAIGLKDNNIAIYNNGNQIILDGTVDVPTAVDQLWIGGRYDGNYLDGFIRNIKYYPRRLSNAQLEQLTS